LRDPKSDSNTIVRLSNAARRARLDFENIAKINHDPALPASLEAFGL
jgi:hypothetical protein